jgi:hypothetical protein
MKTSESEKSKAHIIVEIIENLSKMVVSKTIIPTHAYHIFNANEQFKKISTVIKSGCED